MRRAAAQPLFAGAAIAVLLGACATTAPPVNAPSSPIAGDAPFAIDGRLSARHGRDAIAISFSWTHAPPRDELIVSTPLGQSIAELNGDASLKRVELRTADGRTEVASDWAALTERAVGVSLPVEGLASWAQAAPRANAPHSTEADAWGRPGVLRQDGCEIVYAYADDSTRRPSGIRVACHELEMRIAIDRWRDS
ncbi:MAG TPA: outer membrane lipoprotein LolB [Casimicrobiaceae bacterium]|nr:outer membrane lipoprotein LolB [Casimicrobiaceae bacterium]